VGWRVHAADEGDRLAPTVGELRCLGLLAGAAPHTASDDQGGGGGCVQLAWALAGEPQGTTRGVQP